LAVDLYECVQVQGDNVIWVIGWFRLWQLLIGRVLTVLSRKGRALPTFVLGPSSNTQKLGSGAWSAREGEGMAHCVAFPPDLLWILQYQSEPV